MRILHADSGREMRGGQHQVLLLMRYLREAGVEQTLLARADAPLLVAARSEGFAVTGASMLQMAREAQMHHVVHCHDARTHTWAAIAVNQPIVVSRRVAFPIGSSWMSRWKYRRAARFIAVSRYVAHLLTSAGVGEERIRVIPDAVELPGIVSSLDGGVITIESRDPGKGQALLARLRTPVRQTVDLNQGLATASVYLYLSSMEGLGSAALLAMSYGVPVVASRVGGLPEVVREGETGVLVSDDPEEIDMRLKELLASPETLRRWGANGRERVALQFSPEQMARQTLEVYQQVLR